MLWVTHLQQQIDEASKELNQMRWEEKQVHNQRHHDIRELHLEGKNHDNFVYDSTSALSINLQEAS
jgi:hypothetical protein